MSDDTSLLEAFRTHYYRFIQLVEEAVQSPTDSTVLHRLGDQIDEYGVLVSEVCSINRNSWYLILRM